MTKIPLARQEGIIDLLEQDALFVDVGELAEVLDFLCGVFQYPEVFRIIPQDEPFLHYQIALIPDSITVIKDFGPTGSPYISHRHCLTSCCW